MNNICRGKKRVECHGGILLGVSLRCTFPVPWQGAGFRCGAVLQRPEGWPRRACTCPPPRGPFKARPSRAGQVRAGDVMQQEAGLGLPLPRSARRGKRRRLRTWVRGGTARGGRGECGTGTGTGTGTGREHGRGLLTAGRGWSPCGCGSAAAWVGFLCGVTAPCSLPYRHFPYNRALLFANVYYLGVLPSARTSTCSSVPRRLRLFVGAVAELAGVH